MNDLSWLDDDDLMRGMENLTPSQIEKYKDPVERQKLIDYIKKDRIESAKNWKEFAEQSEKFRALFQR